MSQLIWNSALSIDVPEVDDDHRRLVELFNILSQAVAEKNAQPYVDAVLEELVSCTVWHFRHEERLMLKYGYAGLAEHKREHEELIESAKSLQQALLEEQRTISVDDIAFLEHWLTGHILGADMELGAYLNKMM